MRAGVHSAHLGVRPPLLAFPRASPLVAKTSLRVAFAYYTSPSDLGWTCPGRGRVTSLPRLPSKYFKPVKPLKLSNISKQSIFFICTNTYTYRAFHTSPGRGLGLTSSMELAGGLLSSPKTPFRQPPGAGMNLQGVDGEEGLASPAILPQPKAFFSPLKAGFVCPSVGWVVLRSVHPSVRRLVGR